MKHLILALILSSQYCFAEKQIVLVAHKETQNDEYKKICEKNHYLCFPMAYSSLSEKKSVHFDFLIDNFDLDNKNYVSQFNQKLLLSLKEDDLTLDKIKNLILAAEKINQTKDAKISDSLKKLKKLYSVLSSLPDENADKILFVAGKSISNTLAHRMVLDPYLNDLKHSVVDYNSVTENGEKKYFLNGECDYPRYTEFLTQLDLQVMPYFPEGCNLNQKYEWGTDLLSAHFKENKNAYLVGLATVATIFFLRSYEISNGNE